MTTTLPTIHLNGTSAKTLEEEYLNALRALHAFRDVFSTTTCNARDFYPQSDSAWADARFERADVFAKLSDIEDHLTAWIEHASEHIRKGYY
jgi:hypothetical protein